MFKIMTSFYLIHVYFQAKYSQQKKRFSKKQVVEAIQNFFDKHPSLVKVSSLRDIGDLEKAVSDFLEKKPCTTETARPKEAVVEVLKSNKTPKEAKEIPKECSNSKGANVETDVNPWTLIETFQILEIKESEQKKHQMSELKKKKMAKALNDQIKLKEEATKLEKNEDKYFQRQQNEIIKKWEDEQKLIIARETEKIELLKRARQDQIMDNTARRKKHLADTRASDLKEIQQISKALLQEENKKLEKKSKERTKWEGIKTENAKKVEQRRLRKEEEERIDAKLMAESTAKMDLEEAQRFKAIEDRARKLEANRQLLQHEPDQPLSDGMTSVERSINKKIIEDAQAFLEGRCV